MDPFHQMICKSQEDRCCHTNMSETKSKIMKHPLFIKTSCVVVSSMQRSYDIGVEIKWRKIDAILFDKKRLTFEHLDNQAHYASLEVLRFFSGEEHAMHTFIHIHGKIWMLSSIHRRDMTLCK